MKVPLDTDLLSCAFILANTAFAASLVGAPNEIEYFTLAPIGAAPAIAGAGFVSNVLDSALRTFDAGTSAMLMMTIFSEAAPTVDATVTMKAARARKSVLNFVALTFCTT